MTVPKEDGKIPIYLYFYLIILFLDIMPVINNFILFNAGHRKPYYEYEGEEMENA